MRSRRWAPRSGSTFCVSAVRRFISCRSIPTFWPVDNKKKKKKKKKKWTQFQQPARWQFGTFGCLLSSVLSCQPMNWVNDHHQRSHKPPPHNEWEIFNQCLISPPAAGWLLLCRQWREGTCGGTCVQTVSLLRGDRTRPFDSRPSRGLELISIELI